jgi:cytochrome c-type biogenesis protein CcmF
LIAELGHFALTLALVVAVVQGIVPLLGAWRGQPNWMAVAEPAALLQLALVAGAFGALTTLYVTSDFTVANVVQNSHSAKPMLYKVAGVWGNHEGSMLLWVLILAVYGSAVALFGGNLPPTLKARVLSVQAWVAVGFLSFSLFTSNPFERVFPAPLDGRDLNPLLQDPGLAIHPPMLYLGYVGFSMAFSFAVAALIEGRVDAAWARWVRPWTLVAWCFLGAGIALGSWWAYYELGWGGWWFWDPVENVSFMPWLSGTALLHSAIVVEKRGALKAWTILLAIVTFSLSLIGTFIVRSGLLTSVHAFATDPERGLFILVLLTITIGGSLLLYAWRAPSLKGGGLFAPVSREGGLVLNNLLLSVACGTVFIGTMSPLFLEAFGHKISVGVPYYNVTFVPIIGPLVAVMAVGPFLAWKLEVRRPGVFPRRARRLSAGWRRRGPGGGRLDARFVAVPGHASRMVGSGQAPARPAGGELAADQGSAAGRPRHDPRPPRACGRHRRNGGRRLLEAGGYEFLLEKVSEARGPNYMAQRGHFRVTRDGELVALLSPEKRVYPVQNMPTTEAAILSTPLRDLYTVIGDPDGTGAYTVRIYIEPLVPWLWFGAGLMVLGGLVSLSDRRLRVGAPARRPVASRKVARA